MFSITPSMTSDFAISPQNENSPVSMSKTRLAATVIPRSTKNSAIPIFKVEYFFKIIAMISVPPPEALTLKRIAELNAGSTIA